MQQFALEALELALQQHPEFLSEPAAAEQLQATFRKLLQQRL